MEFEPMNLSESKLVRRVAETFRLVRRGPQPFIPGADDVYLASYPRSGNTWLAATIAEIMFGTSGETLDDIRRYVPDIHKQPAAEDVHPAPFHVVKTHEPCGYSKRSKYTRVVYILRDPRDVALSFYRYLVGRNDYEGTLDDFLMAWLAGRIWPSSWGEHVNSWTCPWGKKPLAHVEVFRYEDLVAAPAQQFREVSRLLGYDLNAGRLEEIVRRTGPAEMRRKEQSAIAQGSSAAGNAPFIGQARAGAWRDSLTASQEAMITARLREPMERFGYVHRGTWPPAADQGQYDLKSIPSAAAG